MGQKKAPTFTWAPEIRGIRKAPTRDGKNYAIYARTAGQIYKFVGELQAIA